MRDVTRSALLLLAVGLVASTAAFGSGLSEGRQEILLQDLTRRSYVVRIPRGLAADSARVPMVMVLHGGGGNAANAESMTGFTRKAMGEGFIVVYPEGSSRLRGRLLTWNAGHCCGYAMTRRVDDVAFFRELIAKLSDDYPVDARRIYITGISNGGMMAHRLGIELSDRVTAIAPVAAALFGDEPEPAQAVSALMLNGMQDTSVPYAGGAPGGLLPQAWDGTPVKPAVHQGIFWSQVNGCAPEPRRREHGTVERWSYACPAGRSVGLYLIKDQGHAWPGGEAGRRRADQPSQALNATDVIWDFFKAHRTVP